MHTTRELLEQLRAKHGNCSYYRVSKILGISDSAVHRWKDGKGGMARDVAMKVAEELKLPHAYVVACIELEREPSDQVKPVWTAIAKMFAGKAAAITGSVIMAAMLAHPQDARAATMASESAGASGAYVERFIHYANYSTASMVGLVYRIKYQ